jgi:hypothetical protein
MNQNQTDRKREKPTVHDSPRPPHELASNLQRSVCAAAARAAGGGGQRVHFEK